ncbi:hypothetical protein [Cellulomonas fimi]|uniref:Tyr recombinase domain-containing protein n=1 Tax=Cellulomonas fimi (strain ATCC 484 / DSM 20113 / JCM 1341 / CCUG 24087 / LMG 16345 / NBRC 15513 / NCIMB 8980 / NCTC 7547 / NRS-133) TaxID=590998 RepID=F4GYZ9_CELFA|nr:hypothetical protein [Cellulomonas fimi]AEE45989.1 hypothetical protein Celf_1859 [Cellulomonas fimi ATCC 484]NNH06575.1 hypothetical protein [Cellulomonas fimi]VEH31209.1 Uncharacterised protein [Cellulomonas fimi]
MQAAWAIERHLATLAASGASASLLRQRRWALRQALTGAALARLHGPSPTPEQVAGTDPAALARSVDDVPTAELASPEFVAWYLPWAAGGALARPERPDGARSAASARARAAALRALASDASLPAPPHTHTAPALRPVIPRRAVEDLLRALTDTPAPPVPTRTRLLAVLAVMAADPAGPTALVGMRVEDASADGRTLRAPTDGRELLLPPGSAAAVRDWLTVRAELVAGLTGGTVHAMWVSAHGLRDADGTARPPGLPLQTRGMERAYTRGMRALRRHLSARPELVPHSLRPELVEVGAVPVLELPPSLELLRRSLLAAGRGPVSEVTGVAAGATRVDGLRTTPTGTAPDPR